MASRWAALAIAAIGIVLPTAHAHVREFTSNDYSNASVTGPLSDWAIYQIGEEVVVTWETDAKNVNVGFSNADDTADWIQVYNGPASGSWTWVVDVNGTNYDSDKSSTYYLVANNADTNEDYFWSGPVAIAPPGKADTFTSATATPTVTAAPTAPPTAVSTVVTTAVVTKVVQPTDTKPGEATSTSTPTSAAGKDPNAAADAKGNNDPKVTATDSKLSTGTIAGIAVGAVAGVAALIAAIFFILRSKKLRKQLDNSEANTHAPYVPYDQVLPGSGAGTTGMVKDPGAFGAAAAGGAAAGAAAGYFGNEKKNPAFGAAAVSESRSDSIMEMSADPIPYRDSQAHADPVEIGGTELIGPRPMDEEDIAGSDSRPLMGEQPHNHNA